ncbi:MAG: insulinase family protein [Sporolactobacillus sp.]
MASFIPDKLYHGFKFLRNEKVTDIHSEAFLFEHVKSGARLLFLKNDDDNKVFSISFRTPPEDDTGVFHILEHSVLCGSDKYPVKEPFVELLKGSLNTFLNAFTFSDKTMYPVASRNDKDFLNLMDVYMDAVLHPNIYKYKEILQQEGWHYELDSPEEPLHYKGVVFNEMKGALSSPESLLMRMNQSSLFPDTSYRYESGGDPDFIPDLTYSHFIESHRKYYSPANSYIYLYGDMDIEEKLAYLDQNYLSDYDRIDMDSRIGLQKPIGKDKEIVNEYPILPDAGADDKTYLSLNFAVGAASDPESYLAFDVLNYLLLDSPAAPLKKALLDAEIGQDVFGIFDNSIQQPYFSINVKNSNESQKADFQKVVFDTLSDLVQNGIDKKLIEAAINVKEFQLREADYGSMPKGLIYSMTVMDSWLYDGDPLVHLKFEKTLATIKQGLTTTYFEQLIDRYLLKSNHQTLVIIKPSKTMAAEEEKAQAEKLAAYKEGLSTDALNQIVDATKKLKIRQESEDKPEDLRKIPLLALSDIDKKSEELPLTETELSGVKALYHELPTNKIVYLSLYFNTEQIASDQVPYLGLLQELLGRIDTEKYSYEALANEINIQTGDIHFENNLMADKDNDDQYQTKFSVKAKILQNKLPEAFRLIHEMIYHSKFSDKNRLKAVIKETKSRLEMIFNQNGQSVALRRLSAYYSQAAAYKEKLNGLSFYQFICDLDSHLEENFAAIASTLQSITEKLFNKDQLIIGLTGDQSLFKETSQQFNALALESKNVIAAAPDPVAVLPTHNEGLMTSSKVQYAAKGGNFKKFGFAYTGKILVLKQILTLDYLWNRVRVMGGAYGTGVSVSSTGNFVFWSYRDPNLRETLKVYDEAAAFAKDYKADEFAMTKFVIGTISNLDSPLTVSAKGELADERYFSHVAQADIQRIREEVLATHIEDIHQLAPLLEKVSGENLICVLGNETKIKENQELFDQVINIFS